jgi:dihydropyrimidine dehydrogenase (NAD+) subunit PreA
MADLTTHIAGIKSPNPFWLASGPPTNTAYQVRNAFDVGWGGAVWKTLTHEPIVNVASRYGGIALGNQKLMGLNNIELISDRSLEDNLREIAEVKKHHPHHAVIASVMVESKRETWREVIKRIQDVGVDGFELNFGCPHGMSERGMGAAVGQVPEYAEMICSWVKEVSIVPVLAKLTPNVTSVKLVGRAVKRGGADGISLINTINSIMGVDVQTLVPRPNVGGNGSHGGYCGPAVKPIALHMVSEIATDPEIGLPISGIGGIRKWDDAAEFILLGASGVQVCTAVMHRGFGVVKQMVKGLEQWLDSHQLANLHAAVGLSTPRIKNWGDLDLNYQVKAEINESTCIHCGICFAACEDGCYQAIAWDKLTKEEYTAKFGEPKKLKGEGAPNLKLGGGEGGPKIDVFTINRDACVGCNMCALACPVEGCITMKEVPSGKPFMSWTNYQQLLKEGQMQPIPPKKAVKTIPLPVKG